MDYQIEVIVEKWLQAQVRFLLAISDEPGRFDSDPTALQDAVLQFMSTAGELEGRRLKGWALIRAEFQVILEKYSNCFFIKTDFKEILVPPYAGKKITTIFSPGKSELIRKCWEQYISGLLSIYGMKKVMLNPAGKLTEKRDYIIKEFHESETQLPMAGQVKKREFVHKMNNHLGSIVSFASLIGKNKRDKENAELVLTAAEKAAALLKGTFPHDPRT